MLAPELVVFVSGAWEPFLHDAFALPSKWSPNAGVGVKVAFCVMPRIPRTRSHELEISGCLIFLGNIWQLGGGRLEAVLYFLEHAPFRFGFRFTFCQGLLWFFVSLRVLLHVVPHTLASQVTAFFCSGN